MSKVVIVGRETAQAVAACLRKRGMAETPVRVVETGQGPAAMDETVRVPVDLLLLDINTGPGLGPAVLRYRLARRDTRIVLLAPGRKPGDAEVASVVQAGVYDVVTELEKLAAVLDRPPADLAAAALWLDPALAPEAAKEQVKEVVIERRVAISQRPVLIAVAGVAPGVGTTTLACTLAGYLARRGYRTVLVEAGENPSLEIIADLDLSQVPAGWLPNLDVCADPNPRNLVRARQHEYVVADMGVIRKENLSSMEADMMLVTLPVLHRARRVTEWLDAYQKDDAEFDFVILGDGKLVTDWSAVFSGLSSVRTNVRIFHLPVAVVRDWPPGYRKASEELDRACGQILADVLPDGPKRRRPVLLSPPIFRPRKRISKDPEAVPSPPKKTPAKAYLGPLVVLVEKVGNLLQIIIGGVVDVGVLVLYVVIPVALVFLVLNVFYPNSFASQGVVERVTGYFDGVKSLFSR